MFCFLLLKPLFWKVITACLSTSMVSYQLLKPLFWKVVTASPFKTGDYPRIKKGTTTNLVSDVAIVYCQSTDKGKGL